MKKGFLLMALFSLFAIGLFTVSCGGDPVEYCEPYPVCEGNEVTVCCTDDGENYSCVYHYNGKEYDNKEDLIDDLNCTSAIVLKSSVSEEEARQEIMAELDALMERAHAGLLAMKEFK